MDLLHVEISRAELERDAINAFRQRFGCSPEWIVAAPGRVNLIGEHTDYNDGFVLPAAITRATAIAAGPRNDNRFEIFSKNFQSSATVPLNNLVPQRRSSWTNYIAGVALLFKEQGIGIRGANLCINGNIPRGSGLSSSASLEIAAAYALQSMNDFAYPALEMIKLCQRAENEFVGVRCGIMDQFISCLGKKDHALMIDCRSLEFKHVPFPSGVRLLVLDTGVKRALASSAYNTRRDECTDGVKTLSSVLPGIRMLRDVTPGDLGRNEGMLNPTIRRRCKHVVTENARVLQSVHALTAGDLSEFGKLMYDSHLSLQHDYEVSCAELDIMVDICAEAEGVYGARMTGAGFGGCAVCLVNTEAAPEVAARVMREYPPRTGKTPMIIECSFEDGVSTRKIVES